MKKKGLLLLLCVIVIGAYSIKSIASEPASICSEIFPPVFFCHNGHCNTGEPSGVMCILTGCFSNYNQKFFDHNCYTGEDIYI